MSFSRRSPRRRPQHADYFSADAEMVPCLSIGGDFYDYLDLDGSFGFVLGDVAGKGASAGLLGARVQEIFAHRAPGADPATPVATINSAMVKKGLEARFVTIFYGILSPEGRLTYCNAGHNPPLLVGQNGVRRLKTGGLIVGLFEEATYEQEVVSLNPGDTLITSVTACQRPRMRTGPSSATSGSSSASTPRRAISRHASWSSR